MALWMPIWVWSPGWTKNIPTQIKVWESDIKIWQILAGFSFTIISGLKTHFINLSVTKATLQLPVVCLSVSPKEILLKQLEINHSTLPPSSVPHPHHYPHHHNHHHHHYYILHQHHYSHHLPHYLQQNPHHHHLHHYLHQHHHHHIHLNHHQPHLTWQDFHFLISRLLSFTACFGSYLFGKSCGKGEGVKEGERIGLLLDYF